MTMPHETPVAQPPAPANERIFTEAEAARFIRRRQRRRWTVRMVLAVVLLVGVFVGPPVFRHCRVAFWLALIGASVEVDYSSDTWREWGLTSVSFPVNFRTNDQFKNGHVARLSDLHRLVSLDLSNAFDVSALGLADLKRLPELRLLDLTRTDDKLSQVNAPPPKYFDGDLVHLEPLTGLRELYLAGNEITDDGLVHLAGLKNLEILNLEETRVTDAGLDHLMGLKKLKSLSLGKAKGAKQSVSPNAAMRLNQAVPDVVIHLKKEYEEE